MFPESILNKILIHILTNSDIHQAPVKNATPCASPKEAPIPSKIWSEMRMYPKNGNKKMPQ